MTLDPGTLLHKRYRIVETLGQGGMGSVYRAVDENLGVDVAVKENLFTSDDYSRQFRLEAVILAALRHPNLPRVSDHFAVGEQGQYLVMDFIEGEDLRQRMERRGNISEEDAAMVGAAMCDALTYLHTRRPSILHRDIKPGNVKITPEGSIFLVDFGLAKLVQGPEATTTGARAMTPGYSPPEQYGTARTDPRTDIYSLGATLYAALSGMIPEDGLARAMDNLKLTPLRKRNSKISRGTAAAIEKAMAVDPADRFQTAEEFKKALLRATSRTERLTGEFTVAPPPDTAHSREATAIARGDQTRKPARPPALAFSADEVAPSVPPRRKEGRGPVWLVLLFASLAAFAAILILVPYDIRANIRRALPSFLIPYSLPTPAATATVPLPVHTGEQVGSAIRTSIPAVTSTAAAISSAAPTPTNMPAGPFPPTGTSLLGVAGGGRGQIAFASDRSGIPQIYLSDLRGEAVTPITNMPDGACQPAWSPDGMHLVFTSPCRVSPAGRPLDISEGPLKGTALYTVNADGSNLVALPTVPGGDSEPAWSPDGKRIAFTSLRDGRALIYALNLTDQSVRRLTDPSADFAAARQPAWSPFGNQIVFAKKHADAYQIWAVTDAGQGQQQIAGNGQLFWDYSPMWSPDGKTILFTERNAEGPVLPWTMNIPYEKRDTAARTRVKISPRPVEGARYSPDGQWLVFEGKSADENRDVFYAMVNGTQYTRLTTDPGIDFDPAWRP
jgi:Tol biopolymer transport system component